MTNFSRLILVLFLLLPNLIFAHGEQIIISASIIGVSFIVTLLIIAFLKIKKLGKVLIAIIYLLIFFVVGLFTENLPALQNQEKIILYQVAIPIVSIILIYQLIKKKFGLSSDSH